MAALFNRDDAPSHLFTIPELDFSADLFAEPLGHLWFTLGARTAKSGHDDRGVQEVITRQSVLLPREGFSAIFDELGAVGNIFRGLGQPHGAVRRAGRLKQYSYTPFYRFELPYVSVTAEPLVFLHPDTGLDFFINPDLWMYLELEERTHGSGLWWDPRRGVDALRKCVMDDGRLNVVQLRTDSLLRYLKARQMSLVVGHYRQLHFFQPSQASIGAFVKGDVVLRSAERDAKAILQNPGLRQGSTDSAGFLRRSLHLWLEISPPEINIDDPWTEAPSFDLYAFTLPTATGPVAPGRWKHPRSLEGRTFEGSACDFMDRVYFRQEVLTKYEGAASFDVRDDGSVSCRDWSLIRSTARLGNELLSTAIGDFAEGVSFEEWQHWKQYAVEPPSPETAKALAQEIQIPEAVNSVVSALRGLNAAFTAIAVSVGLTSPGPLWGGSLDSLAGRQLKWVYPDNADDDEFLKRATLASTLFLEGLLPSSMRRFLCILAKNLHQNFEEQRQSLGPRNLLQRVTLIALVIECLQPDLKELPRLVQEAEGKARNTSADLQSELDISYKRVRDEFAALAFLYDLRVHGGLAHLPDKKAVSEAATKLGLPGKNWQRTHYLDLLKLVTESVVRISGRLEAAAANLAGRDNGWVGF